MSPQVDFQSQWRDRLASGSKLAAHALGQALKDNDDRLALIVPLSRDALPTVRVAALRALQEVAKSRPGAVAPYATDIVAGLGAAEPDAQAAALGALSAIAAHAQPEVALALPLISDLLKARRPALREEAVRCLGRIGVEFPENAGAVALRLGDALTAARNPRASMEAREILAALETLIPHVAPAERARLAAAVAPMRAHPNIQVRERAGRLAKQLA